MDYLKPTLNAPQQDIRLLQESGLLTRHQAGGGERTQPTKGAGRANGPVGMSVCELEELHGELHIVDAPWAELDVDDVGGRPRSLPLNPGLDVDDLLELLRREALSPHEGLDGLQEGGPDRPIAGDRPAANECQSLPRRGAPGVVLRAGVH